MQTKLRLLSDLALSLAGAATVLMLLAMPADTQTYMCGNPSSGHCYGVTVWQEKPEYFGTYTDIVRADMNCPADCGGFIDDEIWLVDNATAACVANPFTMCWVEAGYFFEARSNAAHYFWADSRPMNTSTFNLHILGATEPAGAVNHYMIIKDARGNPGVFQTWVYNDSLSTLYQGTSTSNTMRGNRIIIGQELAGTKNASAGNAGFSRNIWAVQALGPEYVFWYNAQTTRGNAINGNPPFAGWTVDPALPPPEGGLFTTHCCS